MLNLNSPDSNSNSLQDPISLNVGGEIYTTTLDTLTRCRDSMLGAMFTGQIPALRDKHGNIFIDRDGKLFRHILNYLRSSSLDLPVEFSELTLLRREADFFQIRPLLEEIRRCEASVPLSQRGGPLGAMLMVDVDCKVCANCAYYFVCMRSACGVCVCVGAVWCGGVGGHGKTSSLFVYTLQNASSACCAISFPGASSPL